MKKILVERSIRSPDEFINSNIVGTHTLLKSAKKIWLDEEPMEHRFHHTMNAKVLYSGFLEMRTRLVSLLDCDIVKRNLSSKLNFSM